MLVDGGKGLEPQTRKLFSVARRSKLPVFTFVNKMDRPAMSPWDVVGEIEREFNLETAIRTWPIGDGDQLCGIYEASEDCVWFYDRGPRGKKAAVARVGCGDMDAIDARIGDARLAERFRDDREVIAELTPALDVAKLRSGAQTAVYFGSAMSDAGVQPFLKQFLELGARPSPRRVHGAATKAGAADSSLLQPSDAGFAGFVFKLQANLVPKHRDCMAYVRVVSGKFTKGMKCSHSRSARSLTLAQAAMLFGSGRDGVDVAYPGDVIGVNNPKGGLFHIGDALHSRAAPLFFDPIPSFSPEVFGYLRPTEVGASRKALNKGLDQLLSEGAVQRLSARHAADAQADALVAAVGTLQFEVVVDRLLGEYGVKTRVDALGFTVARWARPQAASSDAWRAVDAAKANGVLGGVFEACDEWGRPVLLFRSAFTAKRLEDDDDLGLQPWATPPRRAATSR